MQDVSCNSVLKPSTIFYGWAKKPWIYVTVKKNEINPSWTTQPKKMTTNILEIVQHFSSQAQSLQQKLPQ